jgi:hypothetical protein
MIIANMVFIWLVLAMMHTIALCHAASGATPRHHSADRTLDA